MKEKIKGLPILFGVERMGREYHWARIYVAGRTVHADLSNITFWPCTSRPKRIEVSITEEKISDNYFKTKVDIYASETDIRALCLTLGIGTPSNPVPIDSGSKDE